MAKIKRIKRTESVATCLLLNFKSLLLFSFLKLSSVDLGSGYHHARTDRRTCLWTTLLGNIGRIIMLQADRVRLIFASVSACGLHFWPFGPQLGLRPRYTTLQRSRYNDAHYASPWWRRLYDVVSQPIKVQTKRSLR